MGGRWRTRKPFKRIFRTNDELGGRPHYKASSSHADRLGARIHSGFPTFRCSRRIGRQQLTGSTIYRQAVQSGLGTTRRLLARIA